MKPRRYNSEAIVLARTNYGEADRILVVFSKLDGKLFLIAKGIRKPKSRKRGALEVFTHIRFSAARGKNMDIITEAEIINTFSKLRKDLKKVSVAYFFAETINKIIVEEVKHEELFLLLISYFKELENTDKLKSLRKEFIRQALVMIGYWPENKAMPDPDIVLEQITERKIHSARIGKKLQV